MNWSPSLDYRVNTLQGRVPVGVIDYRLGEESRTIRDRIAREYCLRLCEFLLAQNPNGNNRKPATVTRLEFTSSGLRKMRQGRAYEEFKIGEDFTIEQIECKEKPQVINFMSDSGLYR